MAVLAIPQLTFAHFMVAQKGTLNFNGTGAYLLVSLPTSSLIGIDDDADGLLSNAELTRHITSIIEQVQAGLVLTDAQGAKTLEGIRVSLSLHDGTTTLTDQLIVMGRFDTSKTDSQLSFSTDLWGTDSSEQSLAITVTQDLEGAELITLTPARPEANLYPSVPTVLLSYLRFGLEHILGGLDHLLFLMVVLATGWGFRKIVTALSIFTLGHAISLIAVVYGGLALPASVVEPIIAATIVGLAVYDFWLARNNLTPPVSRLVLIFACALIHGLGLGGALADLGVNPAHQVATLLGFNVGIEVGQVSIAAAVLVVFALLQQFVGKRSVRVASALMTLSAVVMGSIWFVEWVML
ncbi:MAG: HupE/UreJ family protein [Deinococcota bacterium]